MTLLFLKLGRYDSARPGRNRCDWDHRTITRALKTTSHPVTTLPHEEQYLFQFPYYDYCHYRLAGYNIILDYYSYSRL